MHIAETQTLAAPLVFNHLVGGSNPPRGAR